jgi:DNA-binding response OmpR family regulator
MVRHPTQALNRLSGVRIRHLTGRRAFVATALHRMAHMNRRLLLLVDDDEACLFAMRDYFELRGFEVSCARDRANALREIAARRHDLVITDIDLRTDSRHEGLDIVSSCVVQWPGSQVIVLTAHTAPEAKEEALRRGASAVLQKPVPLAEVLAAAGASSANRKR